MKLENKVAIITGGANGIGNKIALTFAKEGAKIVVADIDREGLERITREIENFKGNIMTACVDISCSADVKKLIKDVIRKYNKVDILVNDAAYGKYDEFIKFEEKEWDRVIEVNLKGYFLCSQAVAREMIKKGKGKILSIASIAGEIGFQKTCAYASSKGGVIALTKVMSVELASYGINVNAIAPGPIDTTLLRSLNSEQDIQKRLKRIPLGHLGNPDDVARAALFLVSDDSNYINGEILHLDGGFTAAGILPNSK